MSAAAWRWVRRGALCLLAVVLIVANIAIIVPGFTTTPLWEAEAFHLSVPLNLVAGLGYTSDGTLSGSVLTPFDEHVATGPTVLLPVALLVGVGLDPVVAGRLVVLVFWVALIAGLFVLGRAIGSWFGGLAAAASPLLFHLAAEPSPVQGPTDVLGAIPAAALIVWALVAARRWLWVGGLLLGLAVQATFFAALAAPALLVFAALAYSDQELKPLVSRLLAAVAAALAPTVLYELVKFVSLGLDEYGAATREYVAFLGSQGQESVDVAAADKIGVLGESWVLAPWAMWVLGAVVLLGASLAIAFCQQSWGTADDLIERERLWSRREIGAVAIGSLAGIATFVAWFVLSGQLPAWIRLASPGLLAFVPPLVAAAWFGLWATGVWGLRVARGIRRLPASEFDDLAADEGPGSEQRVTSVDAQRAIDYRGDAADQGRAVGRRIGSAYTARVRHARVEALKEAGLVKGRPRPRPTRKRPAPRRELPPIPGSAEEAAQLRAAAVAAADAEALDERSMAERITDGLSRGGGAAVSGIAALGAFVLAVGLGWGTIERAWLGDPPAGETLAEQREIAAQLADALGFAAYTGEPADATPTPTPTADTDAAADDAGEETEELEELEEPEGPTLEERLAAASTDGDWLAVEWGPSVSIAMLAGAHVGLVDAGDAVAGYPWMWASEPEDPCAEELIRVDPYVVCAAEE